MNQNLDYGNADTTYLAAGGQQGIRKLIDTFYDIMGGNEKYRKIFDMHPDDIETSRDKLALFLCGWMGGPKLFVAKYGQITIPGVHKHLAITEIERDLWLACMEEALQQQEYPESLVEYLSAQLFIPANRIYQVCNSA